MAKRKKRSSTTIKTLERRIRNMSTTRRKKRRRKPATALAAHRKHTVRRRKKGFLHDRGGLMSAVKVNSAASLGGAAMVGIDMLPLKPAFKAAAGFAGAVLLGSFLNAPNVASGLAGANAYVAIKNFFPNLLHDGLSAVSYVDPSTLCDSGYVDERGNAIVQDTDGVMYALNDMGDLEAVADAYSLHDSMQSVSMVPLSDAYSLHDPYALSDRFDIN